MSPTPTTTTATSRPAARTLRYGGDEAFAPFESLDALQSTDGVRGQNFVSQGSDEMRFSVQYAGAVPLQLALYQKLRSRPAFARMTSQVDGRSILLCLTGC